VKPTGKDEATAVRDDTRVLQARIPNWKLEKGGVKRWGENSEANYVEYLDFLLKWGVIREISITTNGAVRICHSKKTHLSADPSSLPCSVR